MILSLMTLIYEEILVAATSKLKIAGSNVARTKAKYCTVIRCFTASFTVYSTTLRHLYIYISASKCCHVASKIISDYCNKNVHRSVY